MEWWRKLPTWQKAALILGVLFLLWLLLRGSTGPLARPEAGDELGINLTTPATLRPVFEIDRRVVQPEVVINRRDYNPPGMTQPGGNCGCNDGVGAYARENLMDMLDIYGAAMNRLLGGYMEGLVEQAASVGTYINFNARDLFSAEGGSVDDYTGLDLDFYTRAELTS